MSRTLNRYVTRATLGLPKHERLEMAAELRTHLLDRAAQLEREGFSREEAEHLAVKGMGDVGLTNRELLGHIFTTPLGWGVLAALVLCGGGWWTWQNVPLPMWGGATWRWSEEITAADLARLYEADAPRGRVFAADLKLPAKTQYFYVGLIPQKDEGWAKLWRYDLRPVDSAGKRRSSPNQRKQARLLLTGQAWNRDICDSGRDVALFMDVRWTPERAASLEGGMAANIKRGRFPHGAFFCPDLKLPDAQDPDLWFSAFQKLDWPLDRPRWTLDTSRWALSRTGGTTGPGPHPLALNRWTLAGFYAVNYASSGRNGGKRGHHFMSSVPIHKHDVLLAVMPAENVLDRATFLVNDNGAGFFMTLPTQTWAGQMGGLPRPIYRERPFRLSTDPPPGEEGD